MNRKSGGLIFNRILLESIQASGKRKTQEPFLYKLWHKLWHTFYETLCQKMQEFTIKQAKTAQNERFLWRRERDSNPCASFLTTAFRVRLVMTSSISLQSDYVGEMPNVCNIQHFAGFGNHIAVILQKSFN